MASLGSQRLGRMVLIGLGVVAVAAGVASVATGSPDAAPSPASVSPNTSAAAPGSPTWTPSPSPPSSPRPSGTATAPGVTKLKTRTGPMGTYLTDGEGHSLYLSTTSDCTGACAQVWPPLLTAFDGDADSGIDGVKVGTVNRPDGARQLTYNGQPLYLYAQDQHAGDAKGQGRNSFGAVWWLVNPNGNPIVPSASPSR